MSEDDLVRAVEAVLFAAEQPLSREEISEHLGGADVRAALATLATHYRITSYNVCYTKLLRGRMCSRPSTCTGQAGFSHVSYNFV